MNERTSTSEEASSRLGRATTITPRRKQRQLETVHVNLHSSKLATITKRREEEQSGLQITISLPLQACYSHSAEKLGPTPRTRRYGSCEKEGSPGGGVGAWSSKTVAETTHEQGSRLDAKGWRERKMTNGAGSGSKHDPTRSADMTATGPLCRRNTSPTGSPRLRRGRKCASAVCFAALGRRSCHGQKCQPC